MVDMAMYCNGQWTNLCGPPWVEKEGLGTLQFWTNLHGWIESWLTHPVLVIILSSRTQTIPFCFWVNWLNLLLLNWLQFMAAALATNCSWLVFFCIILLRGWYVLGSLIFLQNAKQSPWVSAVHPWDWNQLSHLSKTFNVQENHIEFIWLITYHLHLFWLIDQLQYVVVKQLYTRKHISIDKQDTFLHPSRSF